MLGQLIAIQISGEARGMSLWLLCCFCGGYSYLLSQIDGAAFSWDFTVVISISSA